MSLKDVYLKVQPNLPISNQFIFWLYGKITRACFVGYRVTIPVWFKGKDHLSGKHSCSWVSIGSLKAIVYNGFSPRAVTSSRSQGDVVTTYNTKTDMPGANFTDEFKTVIKIPWITHTAVIPFIEIRPLQIWNIWWTHNIRVICKLCSYHYITL